MPVVSLEPSVLLVTRDPEGRPGNGWVPTEDLAERTLKARVKWKRQASSLRFSPATLNAVLDVSDGLFPETAAVQSDLLRSEVYLAVKAATHPVVLFHGWVTKAEWEPTEGTLLRLRLTAKDALGHLLDFPADLGDLYQSLLSSGNLRTSASSLLGSAAYRDYASVTDPTPAGRRRWALFGLLDGGPLLTPDADFFTSDPSYAEVLAEVRHQTQARIGVGHGWEARYPNPDPAKNAVLPVWDAFGTPLPSYLSAEYLRSLTDPNGAFVTATAPVGNPDREVYFSEKTGWLDRTNRYFGYQWTASTEPTIDVAAEPESGYRPELVNAYQRGSVTFTNPPTESSAKPFLAEFTTGNESLFATSSEEVTSLLDANSDRLDWATWLTYNDAKPRLFFPNLRVPVHFVETAELADAILKSNLFSKVRVRVRSGGEVVDRTFRVDGVTWDFLPFGRVGCGMYGGFTLLEVRQETPLVLDASYSTTTQNWRQNQLDNGNIVR